MRLRDLTGNVSVKYIREANANTITLGLKVGTFEGFKITLSKLTFKKLMASLKEIEEILAKDEQ